jgi:hypothetical protein
MNEYGLAISALALSAQVFAAVATPELNQETRDDIAKHPS